MIQPKFAISYYWCSVQICLDHDWSFYFAVFALIPNKSAKETTVPFALIFWPGWWPELFFLFLSSLFCRGTHTKSLPQLILFWPWWIILFCCVHPNPKQICWNYCSIAFIFDLAADGGTFFCFLSSLFFWPGTRTKSLPQFFTTAPGESEATSWRGETLRVWLFTNRIIVLGETPHTAWAPERSMQQTNRAEKSGRSLLPHLLEVCFSTWGRSHYTAASVRLKHFAPGAYACYCCPLPAGIHRVVKLLGSLCTTCTLHARKD